MNRLSDEEFEQKMKQRAERQAELAPILGNLMAEAREAYSLLRPKARHVGEVAMNYPLRHQQIHALTYLPGLGMTPIADYIMIRMRDHDNITIEKRVDEKQVLWKFGHTRQIGPLLSVNTKVQETPRTYKHPEAPIDLSVATYAYHDQWGRNPSFRDNLCDYFENYPGAEERIEEVVIDLRAAVDQHA